MASSNGSTGPSPQRSDALEIQSRQPASSTTEPSTIDPALALTQAEQTTSIDSAEAAVHTNPTRDHEASNETTSPRSSGQTQSQNDSTNENDDELRRSRYWAVIETFMKWQTSHWALLIRRQEMSNEKNDEEIGKWMLARLFAERMKVAENEDDK